MKPIIVEMKNMSDSVEVYESKPNRFLIYTIYLIVIILIVAVLWMGLSQMDIVVKGNGIFKGSDAVCEISSGVTGSVKEKYVENGQYVKAGDVLYVLAIDELSDTIIRYQNELIAANKRLEILSAYEKSLDGDITKLESMKDNPDYREFLNRRELLYANVNLGEGDKGQFTLYQENINSIKNAIAEYKEKISKYNIVKQCIIARNNTFSASENVYYSMVNSYIASYNYSSLQYDNQLQENKRQIDAYEEQIKKAEANVDELRVQRDALIAARDFMQQEKEQALIKLELQQISSIEQQIAGYNETILSLETNLTSLKLQAGTVSNLDNEAKKEVAVRTEKANVTAEILNYKDKVKECEYYLNSYDIQNNNSVIKANVSGYFHATRDINSGSFVQEGTSIGTIYPESETKYYAEIYVENSDIAKIKEGQVVKLEIAAYPSGEYGYFEGTVEYISKDISVDQGTGYSYYVVKVKCDNMTFKGEDVVLMNGMACQAKIVVDEKNVLTYLLEKIDLLD